MVASNVYVSDADLKAYLRADHENVSKDDVEFSAQLEAACREIDRRCGRSFWCELEAADTATARTFGPDQIAGGVLRCDDFWTTDDLVVKTDDDDDGVFETTWTITTDFVVEPEGGRVDGLSGFPFWRVVPVGSRSFPTSGRRRRVQVTARWGWEAVPPAITRATKVAVGSFGKVRGAEHGVAGFADFGAVRIPVDQLRLIEMSIQSYRRVDRVGGVG